MFLIIGHKENSTQDTMAAKLVPWVGRPHLSSTSHLIPVRNEEQRFKETIINTVFPLK